MSDSSKNDVKEENEISESTLKEEIENYLKTANLAKTTTKKVIQTLEKKLGMELRHRKEEIDKIVMDYVNKESENEGSEEEGSKSEPDQEMDSDEKSTGRVTRGSAGTKGKKKATSGGVTKAKRGKGKDTGFTRAYKLSPELSALMGENEMPRHAVVKRIWAMVKEKQMYDPNNKQFAICDEALYKVIGKHRFRVFGMMKYLKTHFL